MLNRYEVVETMVYEVWSETPEQAVAIIANDPRRDARGPACVDRHANLDLAAEDAAEPREWSPEDRALAGLS